MLIQFGNWVFHYRNILFPIFYAALFIPSHTISTEPVVSIFTGSVFILLGIVTRSITIGLAYIVRGGQNRKIYADKLVTEGIYSVCRNPMYLGNILLILGFGIFTNSMVFTVFFFPLFVFIYIAIIRAEEHFLVQKFGENFIFYKNNVDALIPSIVRLTSAFNCQKFDWRKVVRKEYNSWFLYFLGVLVLCLNNHHLKLYLFLIVFFFLSAIYLFVKMLKANHKLDS